MVAPPDNDVLWARGLTYAHDGSPALQGVSLAVREGEILAVTGPRGSGKTTLLRCLSGQLRVRQGEVWFNSVPVHTMGPLARERLRRERFGWIDPEPVLVPELNAWENTALPLMLRGTGRRAAKAAALEWLERLDIRDAARKRPYALLQSERQRVVVARALVAAPTVLFADEPTAPLHRAEHTHVLRTLTTAARSHDITVVLATHDPETAALADRTVTLLDGRHVRTVHLPPPPEAESRATPDANRTTMTAPDHRPTANPEHHLPADPDHSPAPHPDHHPTTEATDRRTTEATSRRTGERTGRPATEDAGRPAREDSGHPTPEGSGRLAAEAAGRPTAQRTGRPAAEGTHRPTTKPKGRPIAEQAGRPPAEGGGDPPADMTAGPTTDTAAGPTTDATAGPATNATAGPATGGTDGPTAEAERTGVAHRQRVADTEGQRATGPQAERTAGTQAEHASDAQGERATGADEADRAGAVGDDRAAAEGEGRAACSLSV